MRVFNSKPKNMAYFFYRIVNPIFDPLRFLKGIYGYAWFIRDIVIYKVKNPKARLLHSGIFPVLHEKTSRTSFDSHVFYQQLWVFEHLLKRTPREHVDIGSTHVMSGYISKITKTIFVDLRPIDASLKNYFVKKGDILHLPFKDNSVSSLSCLHVVEHVGLGRYGDTVDPNGTRKACKELQRVLAKNGLLYFSTPIGRERIYFNAHRVSSPLTIMKYFNQLRLLQFSVVDDDGNFHESVDYKKYTNLHYGCGIFMYKKG